MKKVAVTLSHWGYCFLARPILFQFDSERVHTTLLNLGERLGKYSLIARSLTWLFSPDDPILKTKVAGLSFMAPLGLAAGFDYRAQIPALLPGLGFAYGTVGTLTNDPYGGNPAPRLGRLVRSRSLLVNKGFKNDGIRETLAQWQGRKFPLPVGISIGRTNTLAHQSIQEAIADILAAFRKAEESSVSFQYYELNISCPNLLSKIEFYSRENLEKLLAAIFALRLNRPIFLKMPIVLSDAETLALLEVIQRYPVSGIILGNLQKDRSHPTLLSEEVAKYPKGNFSGLPCRDRSDELISKAYLATQGKIPIIGCGGIFTAEDAYRKIKHGASLLQCVTALIFEGPTIPAKIHRELAFLLRRDGYASLGDAVGSAHAATKK